MMGLRDWAREEHRKRMQREALAPSIDRALAVMREGMKARKKAEQALQNFVIQRRDGSFVDKLDPVTRMGSGIPQQFFVSPGQGPHEPVRFTPLDVPIIDPGTGSVAEVKIGRNIIVEHSQCVYCGAESSAPALMAHYAGCSKLTPESA